MSKKDEVLAEIRKKKIKLWEQPYYNSISSTPCRESLQRLTDTMCSNGRDSDEVVGILLELQDHAVNKLKRTKAALEIKILGLQKAAEKAKGPNESENAIVNERSSNWASLVERVNDKTLKLYQVKKNLSVGAFSSDLKQYLGVESLRFIHKGKTLTAGDARLVHVVPPPSKLLCLASYQKLDAQTTPATQASSLVDSLRRAASKLAADFDVTDQKGQNVSMTPRERNSFLFALGLHRLGRQRRQGQELNGSSPGDTKETSLEFLLEADQEWNNNIEPRWRDHVDNYGLLQLDICWIYLQLESMEHLTDAVERLTVAERVLRNQVHSNFVTLALVQAEMGNPIPPLSAVFARLFLLQGVAYRYIENNNGDNKKSQERLDWAYLLCQSLRAVTTDASQIASLQEALGAAEDKVVAALRRCNGDANQAAALIQEEDQEEELQTDKRNKQHHLGLCQNKTDYVNLDLVESVQTVLGLTTTSSLRDNDYQVATGLLRLSNNDLQACIDLYQQVERDHETILWRVRALDMELEAQGLKKKAKVKLDEIALATLLSMGVPKEKAEQSLQRTKNSVNDAVAWLSSPNDPNMVQEGASGLSAPPTSVLTAIDTLFRSSCSTMPAGPMLKRAKIAQEEEENLRRAEAELRAALQEHDLEKDYFGSKLDEEWAFLHKFREQK